METRPSASTTAGEPLAETMSRLSRINPYLEYQTGIPDGGRWIRLSSFCKEDFVETLHGKVTEACGDRRRAAHIVGDWLAQAAVHVWLTPALAEGRLPLAAMDGAALHVHEDGWVDKVAVDGERVALLPGDPAAGSLGASVSGAFMVKDRGALLDAAVERLLDVGPAFGCIRSVCPVGAPALWGSLVDAIGAQAVGLARMQDAHRWGAWREAEAIMDRLELGLQRRLGEKRPRLKARPRPFAVAWGGGEELFTVRGTCCLYYRTVRDPGARGGGYCNGCPLRSDESRAANLRAYLERTGRG